MSHSLLLDEASFDNYLASRRNDPYVSLDEAVQGKGDALTVDDATHAGFRAVQLALRNGHAVTWMVNGSHVEHGSSYLPFQVSTMLDETARTRCEFDGRMWDLGTYQNRRVFRRYLKGVYLTLRSEEASGRFVRRLSESLFCSPGLIDPMLRTVSRVDLEAAIELGVDLKNHGWTHLNPKVLSENDLAHDIASNETWLCSLGMSPSCTYAPPFGQFVEASASIAKVMLLANRDDIGTDLPEHVLNRVYLEHDHAPSPSGYVSALATAC